MLHYSVGDSGGPLLTPHVPHGDPIFLGRGNPANDLIRGVTSFGDECMDEKKTKVAVVYTELNHFLSWIYKVIAEDHVVITEIKVPEFP